MKSAKLLSFLLIFPVLAMFLFTACLNPLDFDPNAAMATVNVTGSLEITEVSSAVLLISNRSRTINVTRVRIFHSRAMPDGDTKYDDDPIIYISYRPRPLTSKAQFVRPSDNPYMIEVYYTLEEGGEEQFISLDEINAYMTREVYTICLFRDDEGNVIIKEDFDSSDADPVDTGDLTMDIENMGEGSVPWYIPRGSEGHMGAFVVVNLTRDQDIDYVQFSTPLLEESSLGFRSFRIHSGPDRRDQQGIALHKGQWAMELVYTPHGFPQLAISMNAIVMPLRYAPQSLSNYVFFYKTRLGAYDISIGRPPSEYELYNDYDPEEFEFLGPLTGARLTIRNESGDGKFSIVGLEVYNADKQNQRMSYNSMMWNPPGPITDMRMAFIDIVSTPSMPIASTSDIFVASVIVRDTDGNVWDVPLDLYDLSLDINNTLHGKIPGNRRTLTFGSGDHDDLDSGGTSLNTFYFMYQALYDGIILVPKDDVTPKGGGTYENTKTGITDKFWATSDDDFNLGTFLTIFPTAQLLRRIPPTTSSGAAYSMSTNNIYEGDPVRAVLGEDEYYVFFVVREMRNIGGVMMNVERVYGDGPRTIAANRLFLLNVRPDQAPRFMLWNYADRSNRPSGTSYQMSTSRIHVRNPSGILHRTSPLQVIIAIDSTSLHNAGTYRNRLSAPITIFRFRNHNGIIQYHATTDRGGHLPPIVDY